MCMRLSIFMSWKICWAISMNDQEYAALRGELVSLLAGAERELRALGLWEGMAPPLERLASEVPFCHDSLAFTQWLQWIFIPRFRALLEGDHPLPVGCAIVPVAELAFVEISGDTSVLLDQLRAIDTLISGQGQAILDD